MPVCADSPAARRWSAIIDRQEASGLSVRAFAEANGLKTGSLSWWRWSLGRTRPRSAPKQTFTEVVVCEPVEPRGLPLTLPRLGVCLVIEPHTDLNRLREVLEALC